MATSTPQLILVRIGQRAQPLAFATGAPSPHHQMAQSLSQVFTVAISGPHVIQVRVGQQIQTPLALATGTPSPHHQMAQSLPQLIMVAKSTQVSNYSQEVLIRYGYLGNTSTQIMLDLYGHLYEEKSGIR